MQNVSGNKFQILQRDDSDTDEGAGSPKPRPTAPQHTPDTDKVDDPENDRGAKITEPPQKNPLAPELPIRAFAKRSNSDSNVARAIPVAFQGIAGMAFDADYEHVSAEAKFHVHGEIRVPAVFTGSEFAIRPGLFVPGRGNLLSVAAGTVADNSKEVEELQQQVRQLKAEVQELKEAAPRAAVQYDALRERVEDVQKHVQVLERHADADQGEQGKTISGAVAEATTRPAHATAMRTTGDGVPKWITEKANNPARIKIRKLTDERSLFEGKQINIGRATRDFPNCVDNFIVPDEPSWKSRFSSMMRPGQSEDVRISTGLFKKSSFEGMNVEDWEAFASFVESRNQYAKTTIQFKDDHGEIYKGSEGSASLENSSTLGHYAFLLRAADDHDAFTHAIAVRPHAMLHHMASVDCTNLIRKDHLADVLFKISQRTGLDLCDSALNDACSAAHLVYFLLEQQVGTPKKLTRAQVAKLPDTLFALVGQTMAKIMKESGDTVDTATASTCGRALAYCMKGVYLYTNELKLHDEKVAERYELAITVLGTIALAAGDVFSGGAATKLAEIAAKAALNFADAAKDPIAKKIAKRFRKVRDLVAEFQDKQSDQILRIENAGYKAQNQATKQALDVYAKVFRNILEGIDENNRFARVEHGVGIFKVPPPPKSKR